MSQRVVTQNQLTRLMQEAFNHVANPDDWKAEIDCVVPYNLANVYMQAIEFMTGTKPTATAVVINYERMFRLTSEGYRNGPCGP